MKITSISKCKLVDRISQKFSILAKLLQTKLNFCIQVNEILCIFIVVLCYAEYYAKCHEQMEILLLYWVLKLE